MTTRTICIICRAALTETEGGRYACDGCVYRVRAMLRELRLQLPLLAACLTPDGGPAARGATGRAHAPLPVRTDVLDLLGPGTTTVTPDPHGDQTGSIPISACLRGWAELIADDYNGIRRTGTGHVWYEDDIAPCPRQGAGIAGWALWLAAYTPYATARPWIADMYGELEDLVRRARRITRTEPGRAPKTAPCPACETFALLEVDGEWHITCQACGEQLTRDEYRQHAEAVLPGLSTFALWMLTRELQRDQDRAAEFAGGTA